MKLTANEVEAAVKCSPYMSTFFRSLAKHKHSDAFGRLLGRYNADEFDLAEFYTRAKTVFCTHPQLFDQFINVWEKLGGTPFPRRLHGPVTLASTILEEFTTKQALALEKKNAETTLLAYVE